MAEVKELWATSTPEEASAIIRAVYNQVLGNPHLMESERLVSAESQLTDGTLSVRGFVRAVAKSQLYRTRFFDSCAPYRFVELNCLHLLGRAPLDQAEISAHVSRCINEGYEVEINSYINSDEYINAFGEDIVPYTRSNQSITGQSQVGYNRIAKLERGFAQSSSNVQDSSLIRELVSSSKVKLVEKVYRRCADTPSEKRFRIVTTSAKFDAPRRRSTTTYIANGDNITPQLQRINRTGARILSITEIT
ncbi:MAG: phycobilisome rod-core linker polypeptide [Cyanobacteria bacterium P01_F01_bin.150]